MNNYEYIIASLPDIALSDISSGKRPEDVSDFIREQLDEKDAKVLDLFLKGLDPGNLDADFYAEALQSRNRFVREYYLLDLQVRNEKVRHLNKELGQSSGKGVVIPPLPENAPIGEEPDYEPEGELSDTLRRIYAGEDILEKENSLDRLMWDKIEEITIFDDFSLEAVLAFVAKLHIILRWLNLDPARGRELLRQLTDEVRGSHAKLEFNA